ncbi:MAG: type II toxin-antitoxin system VapC family toxin [Planctomycetaceae bacterium]|jgi:predicted nucleic acid-binding protein|nr:type II toxin-antitoxin system VapC family toxin [Planctomycetaceae bacterium]
MANRITYDSSLFIDHFRSRNKDNTWFCRLSLIYDEILISTIVKYEILCGASDEQLEYWKRILDGIEVLAFDCTIVDAACQIYRQLKQSGCLIGLPDILIAATAITNNLPLATLNRKHFERIDKLRLVDLFGIDPKQ